MKNRLSLLCVPFFIFFVAQAQDQLLNIAKQYLSTKDYEKAAATYKQLLEYNENNTDIVKGYLESLKGLKDFKTAEKFLKPYVKKSTNPELVFEYAQILKWSGDEKKAKKYWDDLIEQASDDEQKTKAIASMFANANMYEEAIKVYEKSKGTQKNSTYMYAEELALLYYKKGETEKASDNLLDLYISRGEKTEEVKSTFQRMYDNAEKMELFRKKIMKRISKEPDIIAYPDLLAWLYMQQGDYESAYVQIKAIDMRLSEQGRRVLGFARMCFREKKYNAALLAYDFVIQSGKDNPYFATATGEKLTCMKEQLKNLPSYTKLDVDKVINAYNQFLQENESYKSKETVREYAELEARYNNNVTHAIALLEELIKLPSADRILKAKCKLDMGDYELLRGNIWESTLLYSQVDKDYKNDMLGEEARYKNAKLSYYAGDFKWAQSQLDVLKASTSELIANDALNLSVLITENNPIADSNETPLVMYARADLLMFQNKNEECNTVLDSIVAYYPKHPLQDDILLQKANIALKKQDFSEAAMYLQKIVNEYADDILADDALYQLAYIYEEKFNNKDEAKRLYEKLIVDYPGSTFVNEARKRYRKLRGDFSENKS